METLQPYKSYGKVKFAKPIISHDDTLFFISIDLGGYIFTLNPTKKTFEDITEMQWSALFQSLLDNEEFMFYTRYKSNVFSIDINPKLDKIIYNGMTGMKFIVSYKLHKNELEFILKQIYEALK
jgi:hypothetical protein